MQIQHFNEHYESSHFGTGNRSYKILCLARDVAAVVFAHLLLPLIWRHWFAVVAKVTRPPYLRSRVPRDLCLQHCWQI